MNLYQKSILVLDLKNIILENLENWFLEVYDLKNNIFENYIKKLIEKNRTLENPIEYVFLLNDTVLGFSYTNKYSEIKYSDFLIDDIILLKPISLNNLELYRSVIIDWIFNHHRKNELAFKEIQSLQEFEVEKHQFPNFTSCVCVIDALDLGFRLNDISLSFHQKFKAIHRFFKTLYQTDKISRNVNLTKVFFLDQFVLGFTFQMEGSSEEHFFWNIHLYEQLLLMDKITFDSTIKLTVDNLLDKINRKGIQVLTDLEIQFLNNQ